MLCYRDMTFCGYYEDCRKGKTCHRALTIAVRNAAQSNHLPICQFGEHPDCYKEKEADNEPDSPAVSDLPCMFSPARIVCRSKMYAFYNMEDCKQCKQYSINKRKELNNA